MSSKNISLKKEAYERLEKEKKEGESFSDVVLNLTKESRKDFSNIIGKDIDLDWEKLNESRKRKEGDGKREELLSGH